MLKVAALSFLAAATAEAGRPGLRFAMPGW